MSLSLEQLTQILAKVRISSSHEEEILTAAMILITPPAVNKESIFEGSCTFNEEQLCEQEIQEDNEELQHDLKEGNCAYESFIEKWFEVCTHLDKFQFFSLPLQQQNSFILVNFHFSFEKFPLNILLLLLVSDYIRYLTIRN
jgi:hypothetical protein